MLKTPKKIEKINVNFSVTRPVSFIGKIFATVFLCFIAGERHGSVNIVMFCFVFFSILHIHYT